MAQLPTVAIIGRPNTGKSTLFNRLIGERRAIESTIPGTTRDLIAHRMETETMDFLLLDTGGMGGGTKDKDFEADVGKQSLLALNRADVILFTVNSREELTRNDREIIGLLRKSKRRHVPVILVPTKCDNPEKHEEIVAEFLAIGLSDCVIPVSAPHNMGTEELVTAIVKELKKLHFKKSTVHSQQFTVNRPAVAVIGKPNVGKSSLINALMPDPQRKSAPMLVSPIPGTTRDAVDTVIRFEEKEFTFIDTAGMRRHRRSRPTCRRKSKVEEEIEQFAVLRSIQALERCDVALIVLDATEPVSHQDQRLAALAKDAGKGLIVLLNKIDKLKGERRIAMVSHVERELQFCKYAPIIPCSTVSKEGLLKIFPLIELVAVNRRRRIETGDLRRWFTDAVYGQPVKALAKTKHLTQADEIPPTFVLFVRDPKAISVSELRFLENRLRSVFDFTGVPVRWVTKGGPRT